MPHPIDVHIGGKIRHRRRFVGKGQPQLASEAGVKFPQIQKYETGENKIYVSRLWEIAVALGVDVAFFFEGLSEPTRASGKKHLAPEISKSKETADLMRIYYSLSEVQRAQISDLVKALKSKCQD
ncbi:helix-turn-helix domain-containing protein [Leisingera sp. JC1]|uniref:helix-turn-helix domain-containing protein n=1 Tax=Leisingera sp. JC1 TaxID=1855282 RepID=UPI000802F429|nr:helix-turn-helix transcriptional regulator [Leisingera sp. JC1]OBY25203.1 transcriptional regulator [Leisingera sp. JC1]